MDKTCSREGCTFADTGVCLRNISPADTCPELVSAENPAIVDDVQDTEEKSSIEHVLQNFPSGHVLNLVDVSKLMSKEYTRVIGIIGSPNSGKTAALVSLYLMLCNSRLEVFSYRDSKTLLALEEISRGARRWSNGVQPEQFTEHTRTLDDREPGFVHLRLHRSTDQHTMTLVAPDLPGEWTKALIESNNFKRLSFLEVCEVIWIVIDGRDFRERLGYRHELNKAEILLKRLGQNLKDPKSHLIVFVVTHADHGSLPSDKLNPIIETANKLGFKNAVHHIASFSESDDVVPGTGIEPLLITTLNNNLPNRPNTWPDCERYESRNMMRFRKADAST